ADREDGQLLAAHERRKTVDRRDTRQDRVDRRRSRRRIDRLSLDGLRGRTEHGRPSVERVAPAVDDATEPAFPPRNPHGCSPERDAEVTGPEAAGPLVDLDDRELLRHVEHDAVSDLSVSEADLGDFVPPDAGDMLEDEQRPAD